MLNTGDTKKLESLPYRPPVPTSSDISGYNVSLNFFNPQPSSGDTPIYLHGSRLKLPSLAGDPADLIVEPGTNEMTIVSELHREVVPLYDSALPGRSYLSGAVVPPLSPPDLKIPTLPPSRLPPPVVSQHHECKEDEALTPSSATAAQQLLLSLSNFSIFPHTFISDDALGRQQKQRQHQQAELYPTIPPAYNSPLPHIRSAKSHNGLPRPHCFVGGGFLQPGGPSRKGGGTRKLAPSGSCSPCDEIGEDSGFLQKKRRPNRLHQERVMRKLHYRPTPQQRSARQAVRNLKLNPVLRTPSEVCLPSPEHVPGDMDALFPFSQTTMFIRPPPRGVKGVVEVAPIATTVRQDQHDPLERVVGEECKQDSAQGFIGGVSFDNESTLTNKTSRAAAIATSPTASAIVRGATREVGMVPPGRGLHNGRGVTGGLSLSPKSNRSSSTMEGKKQMDTITTLCDPFGALVPSPPPGGGRRKPSHRLGRKTGPDPEQEKETAEGAAAKEVAGDAMLGAAIPQHYMEAGPNERSEGEGVEGGWGQYSGAGEEVTQGQEGEVHDTTAVTEAADNGVPDLQHTFYAEPSSSSAVVAKSSYGEELS